MVWGSFGDLDSVFASPCAFVILVSVLPCCLLSC